MSADDDLGTLAEAALARFLAGAGQRPEARRETLEAALRYGRPSRTRADKAFFYQGDRAESALLLLEGRARAVQYKSSGKGVELPPLEPGDWLGLPELVLEAPHGCDAFADGACAALAFPRLGFALASRSPGFADLVSRELAREALGLLACLADESPEERIVSFLLARRRKLAGVENALVSTTQERIARSVGATRETVNKRLAALERRGLLRTLRGQIEVLDWEGLAATRE